MAGFEIFEVSCFVWMHSISSSFSPSWVFSLVFAQGWLPSMTVVKNIFVETGCFIPKTVCHHMMTK
jgi:hypothetical protein